MPEPRNLRASGERIEQALERAAGERGRSHPRPGRGAAPPRLRALRRRPGPRWSSSPASARPELVADFTADELVASLLLVQGLHPDSLDARVEGALGLRAPLPGAARRRRRAAGARRRAGRGEAAPLGQLRRVSVLGRHAAGSRRGGHLGGGTRGDPDRPRRDARARRAPCRSSLGAKPRVRRVPGGGGRCRDRPARGAAAHPRPADRGRRLGPSRTRCASSAPSRSPTEHRHLVDLRSRTLLCACRGCFLLFEATGAGGDHFRSVPERYVACADFALSPAQWDSLQIPVSVAFFFLNSALGRIAAFYPGPGRRHRVRAPARCLERRRASEPAARDDAARRGGLSRPGPGGPGP